MEKRTKGLKRKNFMLMLSALVLTAVFVGFAAAPTQKRAHAQSTVVLSCAMQEQRNSLINTASGAYWDNVILNSEETMNVNHYFDGVLGSSFETFEAVRMGMVDTAWLGSAEFIRQLGMYELEYLQLPGLLDMYGATTIYNDRRVVDYLNEQLAQKNAGLVCIGMVPQMPYVLALRQPVTDWSQLAGRKIVTPNYAVLRDSLRELGVLEFPGSANEIYQMLQQGMADGAMIPFNEYTDRNINEIAPYCLAFGYSYPPKLLCISEQTLRRLSDEQIHIIKESFWQGANAVYDRYQQDMQQKIVQIINHALQSGASFVNWGGGNMADELRDRLQETYSRYGDKCPEFLDFLNSL